MTTGRSHGAEYFIGSISGFLQFRMIGIGIKPDTDRQIGPLNLIFIKFNTVKDQARVTRLNCLNHIHRIYVFNHQQSELFQVCSFSNFPFTSIQSLSFLLKTSRFWVKKSEGLLQLSTGWKITVSLTLTRSEQKLYKDGRLCLRSLSVNLVGRDGDLTDMDLNFLTAWQKWIFQNDFVHSGCFMLSSLISWNEA